MATRKREVSNLVAQMEAAAKAAGTDEARLYLEVAINADSTMFDAVEAILDACRGYGEVKLAKVMDVPSTIHILP